MNWTKNVKQRLLQIYSNLIENDYKDLQIVKSNCLALERLLLNKKFTKSEEGKVVASLQIAKALPLFQFSYDLFETNIEVEFVEDFLKGRRHMKEYLLYDRFALLIKNEIDLATIKRDDRVLFVGSGPFPISAILLNKFTGCHVICYEKNRKYQALSSKLIKKLNLTSHITIVCKKGEMLMDSSYTSIIIALLAQPKEKILRRVWRNTKKGTSIICRTSDGLRQVFYASANDWLKSYMVASKVFATGDQTISSVLLVK